MALPERERWARLSPLLDELLECDPAARQDRLAQLQGSDPALAAELQALLAASGAAAEAGFLARALRTEAAAAPTLVGKAVGAYVIDAPLGQGGMGSVWLAHRADGQFEGRVAVKLLHLSLVGRAGARRRSWPA